MKKPSQFLFPTLLTFILSFSLIAQPTITQDASPMAGDIFTQHGLLDIEGGVLGPGGENQVWDLSVITGEFDSFTTEVILPS